MFKCITFGQFIGLAVVITIAFALVGAGQIAGPINGLILLWFLGSLIVGCKDGYVGGESLVEFEPL